MRVYLGLLPKGLNCDTKNTDSVRTIVAAKSLREASEIIGISYSVLKNKMDLTTDPTETDIANKHPGRILQSSSPFSIDYKPMKEHKLISEPGEIDRKQIKGQNLIQRYIDGLSFKERKPC